MTGQGKLSIMLLTILAILLISVPISDKLPNLEVEEDQAIYLLGSSEFQESWRNWKKDYKQSGIGEFS